MPIKIFIISSFLIFNFALAQTVKDPHSISNTVGQIVRDAVQDKKIKDSTAIYGLSILIDVTFKKGKQVVNLTTNNPQLSSALDFTKLEELKRVNFNSLMKKRKNTTFSFKVYFVVYDSKYDPQLVPLEEVSKSIRNIFLKDEVEIINLGSMLIKYDKKIYN